MQARMSQNPMMIVPGALQAMQALQTLRTQPGARTLAMDETTGRIFMPTARFGPAPAGGGNAPILPGTFTLLVAGP